MATPSVVFSLGFEYRWKIGGYDFLEYMSRPEAFEKSVHLKDEYKDFLDYMSNKEKSDGLFTNDKNFLTSEDKEYFRSLEAQSQLEGCPKYFGVISFDNQFLRKYGLMNSSDELHLTKLKDLGRAAINELIDKSKKLDNNNVYWNAAIHTNTDNIHIHYSLCEYHRLEDRLKTQRTKDALEVEAFDALKSKVVNKTIGSQMSKEITEIIRQELLPEFKKSLPNRITQLQQLKEVLPKEVGLQYNRKSFEPYRELTDKLTRTVISNSPQLRLVYKKYIDKLDEATEKYREFYGEGKRHLYANYKPNRLKDFYERAGNIILNEIKNSSDKQLDNSEREHFEKYSGAKNPSEFFARLLRKKPAMYGGYFLDYSQGYKDASESLDMNSLKSMSDEGNLLATYRLAQLHQSFIESEQLYRKAATGIQIIIDNCDEQFYSQHGDFLEFRLGSLYLNGLGVNKNDSKAEQHLKQAAKLGNVNAYVSLGVMYLGQKNYSSARQFFSLAAENGNSYAVAQLSVVDKAEELAKRTTPIIFNYDMIKAMNTLKKIDRALTSHTAQLIAEFNYEFDQRVQSENYSRSM